MRPSRPAALLIAALVCALPVAVTLLARPDSSPPSTATATATTAPTAPVVGDQDPEVSMEPTQGQSTGFARATEADLPQLLADPSSKQLFDEMVACFPEGLTETEMFEVSPCYEAIVVEAARSMEPINLLNAVKALVVVRPNVLAACHNGGHMAAAVLTKRLWDRTASYETQLAQMRSIMDTADDVCQNGYVHGFYDGLGESKPTMDTYRAAAEVCRRTELASLDCGHGLGHTAWLSTKNFEEAVKICGLFTDEKRYRCDDGLIMYIPDLWSQDKQPWSADPRSPAFDADDYYKRSVEVCETWPTVRPDDPEPLKGCWIGIVNGLLFRPITTLTAYGDYDDYASEARTLAVAAERACMSLPPAGEKICMNEWVGSTLYVTKNDPDAIRDFCSLLVKYREKCTDEALATAASSTEMQTELSRYDD